MIPTGENKNIAFIGNFEVQQKAMNGLNFLKFKNLESIPDDLPIHGLVVRSGSRLDRDQWNRFKTVQVVVTATSGFDHIDLEEAKQRGICVMHSPGANVQSAAELTLWFILTCLRRLKPAQQQTRDGNWRENLSFGSVLEGKTLGIVGLGRIGQRVAKLSQAFGMKTIAYDPYLDDVDFNSNQCQRFSFEEVLKLSDVISFHVPKTAETFRMLNRSHFNFLNPGPIIINTSRGSVIAEEDLIHALKNRQIPACGLDVFEREPLQKSSELLKMQQVVATPHVGAFTTQAHEASTQMAVEKIMKFFQFSESSDTLPPHVAWYGAVNPFRAVE
jgi:D-3-phosphoglycerate dehydrogenase / 2-oxoglutarate reductase